MSIKLQSNFIEIALRNGCSPVHLLHIFRTPFPKNTSGRLLLKYHMCLSFLIFQPILQWMFFSRVVYPHWPLVLKLKKILKSFANIIHLFDQYQKTLTKFETLLQFLLSQFQYQHYTNSLEYTYLYLR